MNELERTMLSIGKLEDEIRNLQADLAGMKQALVRELIEGDHQDLLQPNWTKLRRVEAHARRQEAGYHE